MSDRKNQPLEPLASVAEWVAEAKRVHGDDMKAVRAHVAARLSRLGPQERQAIEEALGKAFGSGFPSDDLLN